MHIDRSRFTLLTGGVALAVTLATRRWSRAASEPAPTITVSKSPT